jgi:hypothetical protein
MYKEKLNILMHNQKGFLHSRVRSNVRLKNRVSNVLFSTCPLHPERDTSMNGPICRVFHKSLDSYLSKCLKQYLRRNTFHMTPVSFLYP